MFRKGIGLIVMLFPGMAFAHSGHGHIDAASIWHWLLEFEHYGWVIGGILAAVVWLRILRKYSQK